MVSMDIKSDGGCCPSDYNNCPTIYLTDEQCEALGITAAPAAGTTYTIQCKAVAIRVTSEVEEDKTEGGAPDVSLTLRITDMELTGDASLARSMYPNSNLI